MPSPASIDIEPAGHRELVAARLLARRLFPLPKAEALYEWMCEPRVRTAVMLDPATTDRAVIGLVTWDNETIFGLGVDPAHRGKGLARALMAHAMTPPRPMLLQVGVSNTAAQALYRSLGFADQADPRGEDVYADGTPFLRMHRPHPCPTGPTQTEPARTENP